MDYNEWEKLLRQEIEIPEDLEEGTRLWYDAIQDIDDNPIQIDWTTEEHFKGWRMMSEDKSSLPGVQAAHLRSIDPSTKAADTISWMALIPLITGYAPRQWMKGIDSIIPKKEWVETREIKTNPPRGGKIQSQQRNNRKKDDGTWRNSWILGQRTIRK